MSEIINSTAATETKKRGRPVGALNKVYKTKTPEELAKLREKKREYQRRYMEIQLIESCRR